MTKAKQKILQFLRQNPLATISTIGSETKKPQSALIAFAETDELEIIFETFSFARKQSNLEVDCNISLVIGWDVKKHITLQYEGVAEPISAENMNHYKSIFLNKKTPCTEAFLNHPEAVLYKVKPTWIRYSDYTVEPADILEITL